MPAIGEPSLPRPVLKLDERTLHVVRTKVEVLIGDVRPFLETTHPWR